MKSTKFSRITAVMLLCAAMLAVFSCSKDENDETPPVPENVTERDALVAIYNATNGPGWYDNENWLSDKPLSEWASVETNAAGEVTELGLRDNNLDGTLPHEIGALKKLECLTLHENPLLKGKFPEEVFGLTNLKGLSYILTQIEGPVPAAIGDLVHLEYLYVQGSGTLPDEIGKLQQLEELILCGVIDPEIYSAFENEDMPTPGQLQEYINTGIRDGFSGKLPDALSSLSKLETVYLLACDLTDISALNRLPALTDLYIEFNSRLTAIPAELNNPGLTFIEIDDTNITNFTGAKRFPQLKELSIYGSPRLTSFPQVCCEIPTLEYLEIADNPALTGSIPAEIWNLGNLTDLDLSRNQLTGTLPAGIGKASRLERLDVSDNKLSGTLPPDFFRAPALIYPDYSERTEEDSYWSNRYKQQPGYELSIYHSTDYSRDGEILTLQTATQGSGINLVWMGEGFLDADMTPGGCYEQYVKAATEYFFTPEPAKTYRDYFNVYAVKTVSEEDCANWKASTLRFGYNKDAFDADQATRIARTIPSLDPNKTTIGVIVRPLPATASSEYKFTNWLKASTTGLRVVTVETGHTDGTFAVNVNRQVAGVGFAQLAREDSHTGGSISAQDVSKYTDRLQSFGDGQNLSLSAEETQAPWKHFIGHANYPAVGMYEGGYGYRYGVWRPEPTSVMRDSILYFNAPSRELFVKRVKKLAGETYSWNDFVQNDKNEIPSGNRIAAARKITGSTVTSKKKHRFPSFGLFRGTTEPGRKKP